MQPIYEHKQTGLVMLMLLIFPLLGFTIAMLLAARPAPVLPLSVFLAFMLFITFTFRSLTVQVDARQVLLYFGSGFPRRVFSLEQISTVRVVRNTPWMGLGIHFIRRGLIYNVSGLGGVELTMKDGRVVGIGTDEPAALAATIGGAVGSTPEEAVWKAPVRSISPD